MSSDNNQGSEWRRWDLHLHTKDTNKNDQFTSANFDTFCVTMFKKAIEKKIAAIGITDYFSIENHKKAVEFVKNIDSVPDFDTTEKEYIKNILLLPNVELRMLPVTGSGRLINIHCIFNPSIVSNLDNDFFSSVEFSSGERKYKMNQQGIVQLGKTFDANLNDAAAYKKGVENFIVDQSQLQELLKLPEFAENTIIVVSNSSVDGASGFQKHYDLFENAAAGSLDGVRQALYRISQAIFSANKEDTKYFLGQKIDNEATVKNKCGSLKPCIHGSDAHTEDKLFAPDNDRFCWIKADPTFEGLKQIIYEPADRVFIGIEPPVLDRVRGNKTKYIDSLAIRQKTGYNKSRGVWFDNVHMSLNKELVAIIGNKGSGKSALTDIIGVLGNTHNAGDRHVNLSFLNAKILKFRKQGYAENFEAELTWDDGTGKDLYVPLNIDIDIDQIEKVKYLPQNYFENLTNDLEGKGFDKTLKSVIFLHLPDEQRLEAHTFEDLESVKSETIETDLTDLREDLHKISEEIIRLEGKKHPGYVKQIGSLLAEKHKELAEHVKNKPEPIPDPSKEINAEAKAASTKQYNKLEKLNVEYESINDQITNGRAELNRIAKEREELTHLSESLKRLENQFKTYKIENREIFQKYDLDIDEIAKVTFKGKLLDTKKMEKDAQLEEISATLRTSDSINSDPSLVGKSIEIKRVRKVSLVVKQELLIVKINDIKKVLSQPEKLYQEYREKLGKWEKRKSEIEGIDTQLNSLKFFEKERNYLEKQLTTDLRNKRKDRLKKTIEIFNKKKEIIELYRTFKKSIDEEIAKDEEFSRKFNMVIDVNFKLAADFSTNFLQYINKSRKGTFYGASEKDISDLLSEKNLLDENDLSSILDRAIELLETDQRDQNANQNSREVSDQIERVQDFYDYLFSLEYLKPIYELKLDGKILDELSPGEKGTLLLVFYLVIDKEDTPLIIDQPEDNLDNKSVFEVLTHFIKSAKKRRQIIIVTHNPNLAVGADAEQIIYVQLDKKDNLNIFSFEVGSIENPEIRNRIVEILEGTKPAFDKRKLRYSNTA